MSKLLFSFDALSAKDKAAREAVKHFKKAGATVAQVDVNPTIKKTSGVGYRELHLVFNDSQTIALRIKETGDIFQVMLNKKVIPIRNQDDHAKAIKEMVAIMDRGRAAFQKKLARQKVKLPSSVKTAAPKMEVALQRRRDELASQVAAAKAQLAELNAA